MLKELKLRSSELKLPLESVYFGGGSPSLLLLEDVENLLFQVKKHFQLESSVEITFEVNPDDVTYDYLKEVKKVGINRLSLGIQSFHDADLKIMNRVHNRRQSLQALEISAQLFSNFSIDLIYGIPGSTFKQWKENISSVLQFQPPHISSYALTVEPKTVFAHQVKTKKIDLPNEESIQLQYNYLVDCLERNGFQNYEFSNFGKPGFFSINNSNYWKVKPYLGIGPSAHSYDGQFIRSWNCSNNIKYFEAIENGTLPLEREKLSVSDRYNEYVMTGLRTQWGISAEQVVSQFGSQFGEYLKRQSKKYTLKQKLLWDNSCLKIAKNSRFLSDGIAADLFYV